MQKKEIDAKITFCTFIISGIALIVLAVVYTYMWKTGVTFPSCFFYRHFNVYCPACGGSHAVFALLRGNIIDSFLYHPIVFYSGMIYLVYIGKQSFFILKGIFKSQSKKEKEIHWIYPSGSWLKLGIVIFIINWIVRNILLIGFQIHIW